MFLYCLTNRFNGKRYIGVTTMSLSARWKAHVGFAQRFVTNTLLAKAIRKYGKDAFVMEMMDSLPLCSTLPELFALERAAIKREGTKAPRGYNLTDGGEGTIGYKYTEEQRAKMRGRKHSLSTREKMSVSQTGRSHTPEAKAKIGAAAKIRNTGRRFTAGPMSESRKEALRAGWAARKGQPTASRGVKKSPAHAAKLRAIWASKREAKSSLEVN